MPTPTSPTLHIGTSGYSYKEWKGEGKFFPPGLSPKKMLAFYAERFNTVEINASFYRLPTADTLKSWAAETPEHFTFTLKAPQKITHFSRLKDVDESVSEFITAAQTLKSRRGPLLFGLPPNMKKDTARLEAVLKLLSKHTKSGLRSAFEFRHASWFDAETFDLLRKHNAALCIAEADEKLEVPFEPTADWGYIRLRTTKYTDAQLKAWLQKIRATDWSEAFIYFKHEDEGTAPKFAAQLIKLAAAK